MWGVDISNDVFVLSINEEFIIEFFFIGGRVMGEVDIGSGCVVMVVEDYLYDIDGGI